VTQLDPSATCSLRSLQLLHSSHWLRSLRRAAHAASRRSARALRFALVLALALLPDAASGRSAAQDPASDEPSGPARHQLPRSREIDTLAKRAARALDSGSVEEAAELLQRLMQADPGLVIEAPDSATTPVADSAADPAADSAQLPASLGVSVWARAQWERLPAQARRPSHARSRDEAAAAFAEALARGDAQALRATALRWPLEATAARAWLACGDLESASGRDQAAVRAWREAARLGLAFSTRDALRASAAEDSGASATADAPTRTLIDPPRPPRAAVPEGLLSDLACAWTLNVPPGPYLRRSSGQDKYNLWPCVEAGRVLYSNGIELCCADVSTGQRAWSSGEPAGWEDWREDERPSEFFRGADPEFAYIEPAAAHGIAVAALQVPWRDQENDSFQHITIMRPTPERRLFGFDLATGARLWSHEPPEDWDGESGAFEQRMRVAGPPLVAEGRVWAPFCRMSGRIEYHVGCFDLASGKRLWTTWVVSGQGELNMFNRYLREYCAAPLVLEAGRIYAQTNLGVLAALDADTGRALWSAEYDSIAQAPSRGMGEQRRPTVWRNSAPRLAAGLVLSTPTDAAELYALDAATGRRAWELPHARFTTARAQGALPSVLLGADESSVWLGGRVLGRWTRAAGLRAKGSLQAAWARVARPEDDGSPRALLAGEVLLVPTASGPEWVDAADGNLRAPAPDGWDRRANGNVLIAGARMYALSGWQLSTCLDWSALLEKTLQRLRGPAAAVAALELVDLRQQRARVLLERGRAESALAELDQLRLDLPASASAADELRERLVEVSLREAEILASLGRDQEARARLEAALATTALPQQRLLLQLAGFDLVPTEQADERTALLEGLARLPPELEVPPAATALHAEELYGSVLSAAESAQRSSDATLALATWLGLMRAAIAQQSAQPTAALQALQELLLAPAARADLTRFALWAPIAERMRALAAAAAPPSATAEDSARGQPWHAAYEPRATAELDTLRHTADARRADDLADLRRRYPLSRAARDAEQQLCEWMLQAGDITGLADLATELRARRSAITALERPVLEALSKALQTSGNPELAAALDSALRDTPGAPSASDRSSARAAPTPTPPAAAALTPPAPSAELAQPLRDAVSVSMPCRLLGTFAWHSANTRDSDAAEHDALALVWRNGRIEGWSPADLESPRWVAPLFADVPPNSVAASAGRVCLSSEGSWIALDLASGELAWRSPAPGEDDCTLSSYSGIVLASASVGGRQMLVAREARSGAELWSFTTNERLPWQTPVCGEGRIALLAPVSSTNARLVVVDGLRGGLDGEYELGFPIEPAAAASAWIEEGRLCVPRFKRPRGQEQVLMRAYSLREGSLAWTLGASGGAELEGLLEHAGTHTLVTRMGRAAGADPSGALLRLDVRTGTADTLMRLRFGERIVGLLPDRTLRLDEPFIALFQEGARPVTPLALVELQRGVRWLQRLPAAGDDIEFDGLPAPRIGSAGVLVAWRQRGPDGGTSQLMLSLYDRADGRALWEHALDGDLAAARDFELAALGALVLGVGDEEHFQLWESRK
jgi:outer membrane protein assembly factor BamB